MDIPEGPVESLIRIAIIAREELLVGFHHAARRVQKALAGRIVASPCDERAHRVFGFLAGGPSHRCGHAVPVLALARQRLRD